jgi:N-acetylglucosaminyl-diphospho-decaprenol L-rhamnosyltransferase
MSDIGIIIVTYNSESVIGACLDAAIRSHAQIVVVDNGSTDGTVGEIARRPVRLMANPANRGFAGAVNQGFVMLNCPYIVLLNPDAILESSLEPLREACQRPGVAGAGGRLLDVNGLPQIGFMVRRLPTPPALILEALVLNRVWPANPVNRRYRALDLDYSRDLQVEQPSGAFLMVRRSVWQELGGLDEGFFPLWFEDVDLCRRILDRGLVLYFTPKSVAKHTGAHSIPSLTVEMRRVYWYRSLLRYSAKHFRPAAFRMVCLSVVAGSILRGIAESARHRNFKPLASYAKIVRLAGRYFFQRLGDAAVLPGPRV